MCVGYVIGREGFGGRSEMYMIVCTKGVSEICIFVFIVSYQ